jgi:hypothetical protein
MSICSDARSLAALAVLGVSLGSTACFDVNRREVTGHAPLLLDDFEDGDQAPTAPQFQTWACYPWQTDAMQPTCVATGPGFKSEHAEAFGFELGAPLDGAPDTSVGAGLGLFAPLPVDLSVWTSLRFDAKFEPSAGAAADGTTLWVRLKCGSADHTAGSVPGDFGVDSPAHVAADWSSITLPWTSFQQPDYQFIALNVLDCIAKTAKLEFEIQRVDDRPDLIDGRSGTLTLDNVVLE